MDDRVVAVALEILDTLARSLDNKELMVRHKLLDHVLRCLAVAKPAQVLQRAAQALYRILQQGPDTIYERVLHWKPDTFPSQVTPYVLTRLLQQLDERSEFCRCVRVTLVISLMGLKDRSCVPCRSPFACSIQTSLRGLACSRSSAALALSELCLRNSNTRLTVASHVNLTEVADMLASPESPVMRLTGGLLLSAVTCGEECTEPVWIRNMNTTGRGIPIMDAVVQAGGVTAAVLTLRAASDVVTTVHACLKIIMHAARSSPSCRELLVALKAAPSLMPFLKGTSE